MAITYTPFQGVAASTLAASSSGLPARSTYCQFPRNEWPVLVQECAAQPQQVAQRLEREFAYLAFHFSNAAYVPWKDLVSDPTQEFETERSDLKRRYRSDRTNRLHYWANNQCVRAGFLELVGKCLRGDYEREAKGSFLADVATMHRHLMLGGPGMPELHYYTKMFFAASEPADPQENLRRLKRVAGRIIPCPLISTEDASTRLLQAFHAVLIAIRDSTEAQIHHSLAKFCSTYWKAGTEDTSSRYFFFVTGGQSVGIAMVNGLRRLAGRDGRSFGDAVDVTSKLCSVSEIETLLRNTW